jgi:hypothetical protein
MQEAGGKRQEAGGRRQEAGGRRQEAKLAPVVLAFSCLLLPAPCLLLSLSYARDRANARRVEAFSQATRSGTAIKMAE